MKQVYDFNILTIVIALIIFRNANTLLVCQIINEKLKTVCIDITNYGNNK